MLKTQMKTTKENNITKLSGAKLNHFSLNFSDAKLEKSFREMHFEKSIFTLRLSVLTSIILYAAFMLLDKSSSPIFYREFFFVRLIIVIPFLILLIATTFFKIFKKVWQLLMVLSIVVTGSGIIYMLHRDPVNMYYYGGVFLVLMGAYFFIKLRFLMASISGLLLLLIYTISYFIIPATSYSNLSNIITGNAFFIASNIICMIGLYSSEKRDRIGFYTQILLNQKQREIEGINENLELKVKERTKQLYIAKEKAEESDRLKSAFLMNMSHEIRTPLNAVLGFSELLVRPNVSENEKATYSDFIRLNGESLAKIIDDIIDISKLQSKQLAISNTSFNLNTLLNELYNYYSSVLVQKSKTHINLVLDIPLCTNADCFIKSDEQRLKQIFNNLISNAIKYTEKGQISFGYQIEENKLNFFVKDTGFGIEPKNMELIFDRFVQFSPQYISRQDGTGLGLSICKNLVILLGGELKVESKVNKGSKFFFQIPLIKAEQPVNNNKESNLKLNKDLSKYRILITDDENSNYVLTKRILKPSKVNTDWAQNGKQALEMAKTNSYDLIIMDIKMPEMDGIEATRRIKKINKDIPIIIQTAFAMKETRDEALNAGCDGFMVKPIALDVFMELVNKHIKFSNA